MIVVLGTNPGRIRNRSRSSSRGPALPRAALTDQRHDALLEVLELPELVGKRPDEHALDSGLGERREPLRAYGCRADRELELPQRFHRAVQHRREDVRQHPLGRRPVLGDVEATSSRARSERVGYPPGERELGLELRPRGAERVGASCCSRTRASRPRAVRRGGGPVRTPTADPERRPRPLQRRRRERDPARRVEPPGEVRHAVSGAARGAPGSPPRSAASARRTARRRLRSRALDDPGPTPAISRPPQRTSSAASVFAVCTGPRTTGRQSVVASVSPSASPAAAASAAGPSSHGRVKSRWSFALRSV